MERRNSRRTGRRCRIGTLSSTALCLLGATIAAGRALAQGPAPEPDEPSLAEVNKALSNPVSSVWSITFQHNDFRLASQLPGDLDDAARGVTRDRERWSSNLLFQPVLPVGISRDWNLIIRPVIPIFVSQPHPNPSSRNAYGTDRTTAFGDITLLQLVSPTERLVERWLLGIGPTWIFPTAGSDSTGYGRYQVGPAAVVGYLGERWIGGMLAQNWTSFAGSDGRAETSSMNLQPFFAWFLRDGWSLGYSGNVLANWEASGDEVWTVPVGVAVARVVKLGRLPVRIAIAGQYMPIHPDELGQKWNLQLTIAPVLPKLIRGHLVDPRSLEFGLGR